MAFHDAQTPEDLPPSHVGEPYDDEPTEEHDTALTTWLDARQPTLEPIDALTGQKDS